MQRYWQKHKHLLLGWLLSQPITIAALWPLVWSYYIFATLAAFAFIHALAAALSPNVKKESQ